jgi:hypothetical protein
MLKVMVPIFINYGYETSISIIMVRRYMLYLLRIDSFKYCMMHSEFINVYLENNDSAAIPNLKTLDKTF